MQRDAAKLLRERFSKNPNLYLNIAMQDIRGQRFTPGKLERISKAYQRGDITTSRKIRRLMTRTTSTVTTSTSRSW